MEKAQIRYLATAKDTKRRPVVRPIMSVEQTSVRMVLQIPRYPSVIPQTNRSVIATKKLFVKPNAVITIAFAEMNTTQ